MPGGNGVGQIIPPIVTIWLREVAGQQHQKKAGGPSPIAAPRGPELVVWRDISLIKSQPTPAPSRFRHHLD